MKVGGVEYLTHPDMLDVADGTVFCFSAEMVADPTFAKFLEEARAYTAQLEAQQDLIDVHVPNAQEA